MVLSGRVIADSLDEWEPRSAPGAGVLKKVVFGRDRFVAIGESAGAMTQVLVSSDGVAWESHSAEAILGSSQFYYQGNALAYGQGRFVTVGARAGRKWFLHSTDGIEWRQGTGELYWGVTEAEIQDIAYGHGTFVAVGWAASLGWGLAYRSTNGVDWTRMDLVSEAGLRAAGYGCGTFVGVGGRSPVEVRRYGIGSLVTSMRGSEWTSRNGTIAGDFTAAAYGNGVYVVLGSEPRPGAGNADVILTSGDSIRWSRASQRLGAPVTVTFGGGIFVTLADGGIWSSADGESWTLRRGGAVQPMGVLNSVAFGLGTFVAVGDRGLILQSGPVPKPTSEPVVRLRPPSIEARGSLRLVAEFPGCEGTAILQSSQDLHGWDAQLVDSNVVDCAVFDLNAGADAHRYYRARLIQESD